VRIVTLLVYDPLVQAGSDPASGLPGFDFVLERGSTIRQPESDPISWLCSRFGLLREPDWPVAPLLARAAGLPSIHPVWLCADPVHIELGSQRTTVTPPAALALDETESAELAGALDSHFSARGSRLFAFDRDRWLINTRLAVGIDSRPLNAMPADVSAILASGPDSACWNAFLTEAQMLLHAHPVNIVRQAGGKLPINSVHLWGGGGDPQAKGRDALVAGDDPLTLALSAAAGAATAGTARELIERTQFQADCSALIVGRPAGGRCAVSDDLRSIDREWIAPLLEALRGRRIHCLELVMPQAQAMTGRRVTRAAFWKFWKGVRPMAGFPARVQGK
jgi:hypothetical protein